MSHNELSYILDILHLRWSGNCKVFRIFLSIEVRRQYVFASQNETHLRLFQKRLDVSELAYGGIIFASSCWLASLTSPWITFIKDIIVICIPLWIRYCLECTRALKKNNSESTRISKKGSAGKLNITVHILYCFDQESPSKTFHRPTGSSNFDCFGERDRTDSKNIQKSLPKLNEKLVETQSWRFSKTYRLK